MRSTALVSISFCAQHNKGAEPWCGEARWVHGQHHAEWLEECIDWWGKFSLDVIVSATAFPGILNVNQSHGNCERDVWWRIFDKARIVSDPNNPGHQVGASLTIRMGLEAAGKLGYPYLIHTAEDVLPNDGVVEEMLDALESGDAYAGEQWGQRPDELNSQFFGCYVEALVPRWDHGRVHDHRNLESYMAYMVGDLPKWLSQKHYRTTHDLNKWRQWAKEEK